MVLYKKWVFLVLPFFCFSYGCSQPPHLEPILLDPADLRPPQVVKIGAIGTRTLQVQFDKPARLDSRALRITPSLPIQNVEDGGTLCVIHMGEESIPGNKYTIEARAQDEQGNTSEFLYRFYGFNPRIPQIRINEFITTAASTVLTQVELVVLSEGNMGGVTFYEGTKSVPDKTFIFPQFEVKEGDFILLHFKPEGTPEEIDETEDKTLATGKGASSTAFDFWAMGTGNLSQDNDVLTLYSNPEGSLLDAVLYSSKVFEPGMRYNGFGTSAMLEKVQELKEGGGWVFSGSEPFPSDGVNPKGATSRRSISRDSRSSDTDSKTDWHIVPSGAATFGAINSDLVYTP